MARLHGVIRLAIVGRNDNLVGSGDNLLGSGDNLLGRSDTILSLLPNAGEGGRRPDEGAPRAAERSALTRSGPASVTRATSPGPGRGDKLVGSGDNFLGSGDNHLGSGDNLLGRSDTILSLLPNAGEGGRRPDEGAPRAAKRSALTRSGPAGVTRATSPGPGRGDKLVGRGDNHLGSGDNHLGSGDNHLGSGDNLLGRSDTILSLLPNAGEGGRRPDEGAPRAAKRSALTRSGPAGVTRATSPGPGSGDNLRASGDNLLGSGDKLLGRGDKLLGSGDKLLGSGDNLLGRGDNLLGSGRNTLTRKRLFDGTTSQSA